MPKENEINNELKLWLFLIRELSFREREMEEMREMIITLVYQSVTKTYFSKYCRYLLQLQPSNSLVLMLKQSPEFLVQMLPLSRLTKTSLKLTIYKLFSWKIAVNIRVSHKHLKNNVFYHFYVYYFYCLLPAVS